MPSDVAPIVPAPDPARGNPIVAAEYDFPPFAGRPRCYVIAESPRSGSQLLADLLWRSGRMGAPGEYLNAEHTIPRLMERFALGAVDRPGGMEAYLRALVQHRTSPNGVFGLKAHFNQARPHLHRASLRRLLRRSQFVWLRRRDVLGQAISYLVALRSGRWRQLRGSDPLDQRLEFSDRAIERAVATIEADERLWQIAFEANRIEPLVVWYEDIVADPDPVCRAICQLVGVTPERPFRLADSPLERQSEPVKAAWRRRFVAGLNWRDPPVPRTARAAPSTPASDPASAPPSPDTPLR